MREAIVTESRRWIGTPFHLHGRRINIGVDCIGLIIGVAGQLNLHSTQNHVLPHFDAQDYHPRESGSKLEQMLKLHLVEKSNIEIGDVILFQYDAASSHVGIVGDYAKESLSIVHANMRLRKVVEHQLEQTQLKRIVGIYSFIDCQE